MSHIGAGEAVIAVTALFLRLDQPAALELGQMRTRGLRRDPGLLRELARGQRAPVISAVSMLARGDRRPAKRPWRYRDLLS